MPITTRVKRRELVQKIRMTIRSLMSRARRDGMVIRSQQHRTPEGAQFVDETMKRRIVHKPLGPVSSVERWGIKLPIVPKKQQCHTPVKG